MTPDITFQFLGCMLGLAPALYLVRLAQKGRPGSLFSTAMLLLLRTLFTGVGDATYWLVWTTGLAGEAILRCYDQIVKSLRIETHLNQLILILFRSFKIPDARCA